jgi:Tol biopolymer transport system component
VAVTSPPRGPGTEHDRELADREALIVEARRRARRRRVGIALALGVVAVAVASLGGVFGGSGRGAGATALTANSGASGQSSATRNKQIVMADWDSGQVELVNPNGSGLHKAPAALSLGGSASPNGKQLAFVSPSNALVSPSQEDKETLYLAGADGQHPRRLTACGACAGLNWSPDGSQIAVVRFSDSVPGGGSNVWVVNAKTGAMRQITHCGVEEFCAAFNAAPQWSPTGGRILFIGPGGPGPYGWGLDTIRPDGSDPTTLATNPPTSTPYRPAAGPNPQWSPDGREIAFDLHNDIYIINANGTDLRRLVTNGGDPAWSPDGTRLLYATIGAPGASLSQLRSRHIKLWTINADGSDNRLLYRYPWPISDSVDWRTAFVAAHVWSPDGKQIAFSNPGSSEASSSDTEAGTYLINADGSDPHRIAPGSWGALAWQPGAMTHSPTPP